MVSNNDDKMIARARHEAEKSPCKIQHGCIAAINGKYVSGGYNHYRQHSNSGIIDNPCSCHAEMHVLHKCLKSLKRAQIRKLTFYIIRLSASGTLRTSAPCKDCLEKLEKYNIKRLIYSTNDGKCISIRNRDYTTDFITRSKQDYLNGL